MSLTLPDFQLPSDPYVKLAGRPNGQTVHGAQETGKSLTFWSNKADREALSDYDGQVIIDSQLSIVPSSRTLVSGTENAVLIGDGSAITINSSAGHRAATANETYSISATPIGITGFRNAFTANASASLTWSSCQAFQDVGALNALTTGTHTAAVSIGFRYVPTITAGSGATFTVSRAVGLETAMAFVKGGTLTVTDSFGVQMLAASESGGGSSTYTRHTGLKLKAQTLTIGTTYSIDSDQTDAILNHAGPAAFIQTYTGTAAVDNLMTLGNGATITLGTAVGGVRGLLMNPTINYDVNGLSGAVGVRASATAVSSAARTWPGWTAFSSSGTIKTQTTGTSTAATFDSFNSSANMTAGASTNFTAARIAGVIADATMTVTGTLTVTDIFGFRTLAYSESGAGTSTYTRVTGLKLDTQVLSGMGTVYSIDCPDTAAILTHAGEAGFGMATDPALGAGRVLEIERTFTLTAGLTEGYAAALTLDPGYTGAQTVTRHNYIDVQDVSVAASAVVTNACIFRFDAAAGTHKAVDAGTTKTTPGAVTQWLKVNVNGTLAFIPSYSSKTS